MGIFNKRTAFKPFEYPEAIQYKDSVAHSYWLVSEFSFTSDIQDFNTQLTPVERNAVKNTLLAISQIEVSVKKFWSNLGNRFPKAEFDQVGITFGESEVRHADAYSHLLQVLGLNDDFEKLLEVPAIRGRVNYLTEYIKGSGECSNKEYALSLALFSIFIENVSLFSQFLIIKAFNKEKNLLKDVDNVIQATIKEETIHSLFGIYLLKQIKNEHPSWFGPEFYEEIRKACLKSYKHESHIIDWIFEEGELDFLSKDSIKEFIKHRFNESMEMIGGEKVFDIYLDRLEKLQWFNDELYADVSTDFFHKRPVTYSKKTQAITANDLF